ncbi:MAG TPA: TlpA disulfide reductase family protein [Chthonomonadaceae bacterium]|nr:TlpA disulfide reductase family protein [Chthonomonadaceae bacterium]
MSSSPNRTAAPLLGLAVLALGVGGIVVRAHADETSKTQEKPITVKLTLDPSALDINGKSMLVGYYPIPLQLSAQKPASVKKEPVYKGTPQYAIIHLGNGPKADTVVALDTPADGEAKIYVDTNHNGNLTDDGDGAWSKKTPGSRTQYGPNSYVLRASWGTDKREKSSGKYGVGLYYFVGKDQNGKPTSNLFMMRETERVGTITLDGKKHKIALIENDANALYNKPVETDDKGSPVKPPATRPVWLLVDVNDDGKFGLTPTNPASDIRAPFELAGKTYEASVSDDGAILKLMPTTKVVATLTPKPAPRPELLKAGVEAPNFNAEKWGGGTLQLSDYKGKIVIVDFWATWCGPCQLSMPHIEKVYKAVKDKDIAVVGICVWDEKEAYTKWVPENKEKYTFTFAFDPAGKDNAKSIASSLYKVSGIPTTYIIDKDGKVAATIVGYSDGDTRVEEALKKLGVEVPKASASATDTKGAGAH